MGVVLRSEWIDICCTKYNSAWHMVSTQLAIFILTTVVVITIINNIMFCATNHSTEQSLFGREEWNMLGAACALTLQNNPDEKILFWSNFSKH